MLFIMNRESENGQRTDREPENVQKIEKMDREFKTIFFVLSENIIGLRLKNKS